MLRIIKNGYMIMFYCFNYVSLFFFNIIMQYTIAYCSLL